MMTEIKNENTTGKQKYTDYNLFIVQDPDRIHT